MGVLDEIKQKLASGKQPVELVKEGYAKSSVYYVAKKIRNVQSGIPGLPVDAELAELRRRKEIIKLEKEIAELEAGKEKLPERVTKIEAELRNLRENLVDIWTTDMCDVLKRIECPEHGKTLGFVVGCRECNYTLGLGWKDST